MTDIRRLVTTLLEARFSVFVGAGLSYGAGIPLAKDLQSFVLSRLECSESAIEAYFQVGLPFEAFFEVLLSVSDGDSLLPLFAGSRPTRNHVLLARLCHSSLLDTVVTTNFDSLIERAFEESNLPYRSYVSDNDLVEVDWASETYRLIKLHGTIGDLRSLAVTIRKVAARNLAASRAKVIQEFLAPARSKPCLVFGYSGSDRFDISPAIRATKGPYRPILYVQHDDRAATPSFGRLSDTRPDHVFASVGAEVLVCRADDLVSTFWEVAFGESAPPLDVSDDESWRRYVNIWLDDVRQQHGPGFAPYVAGLLQKAANNWPESNILLERALEKGILASSLAGVKLAMGNNHRDMGDLPQARSALVQAREAARAHGQVHKEASALNSLGIVFEDEKNHEAAISHYETALEMASGAGNSELEGKCPDCH